MKKNANPVLNNVTNVGMKIFVEHVQELELTHQLVNAQVVTTLMKMVNVKNVAQHVKNVPTFILVENAHQTPIEVNLMNAHAYLDSMMMIIGNVNNV